MPVYEYFCRECGATFEKLLRRPAAHEAETASCPAGHDGAARTLSLFATPGRAAATDDGPMEMAGGGCCGGGGCACAAGGFSRN